MSYQYLPIEIIEEILSFNNIKLVLNKKTNQYDTKILSYDVYQNISTIYSSILFDGLFVYRPVNNYFIKWYEISYKNK